MFRNTSLQNISTLKIQHNRFITVLQNQQIKILISIHRVTLNFTMPRIRGNIFSLIFSVQYLKEFLYTSNLR